MTSKEIEREKREAVVNALESAAKLQSGNDTLRITMAEREKIAAEAGCSVWLVNKIIKEQGLKRYRNWTKDELKDIWCNYQWTGAKALAEKYGVTPRIITQQIWVMRHADNETPWIR